MLADGHATLRHALRRLLDQAAGIEVIAEAGDLATVRRLVHADRPRVLVIDLSFSNGSTIGAIRNLREAVPSTRIVALTMEPSRVFARAALDAGASGLVLKQLADEELVEAVRSAARGDEYLSPHQFDAARSTEPSGHRPAARVPIAATQTSAADRVGHSTADVT